MPTGPTPLTSASLLGRLRLAPADQSAWAEFVGRYGPLVYDWCRQWRLQDADAKDVTQGVLLHLVRRLQAFEYDPGLSFRGWLRTVARHAWADFVAAGKPAAPLGPHLGDVAARDTLLARLDEVFDWELLHEAEARVRLRVAPHTWEAFRLTTADGLAGADAAAKLGMSVVAVFKAKSKVVRMLREEVRKLGGDEPADPA